MISGADDERGERGATDRSLADERDLADSEIGNSAVVTDELADDIFSEPNGRRPTTVSVASAPSPTTSSRRATISSPW